MFPEEPHRFNRRCLHSVTVATLRNHGTVSDMTLVGQIAELQNYATYKELSWEGSFEDYLNLVRKTPQVTRNAYQRLYDMVLSHGVEEYIDNKKKLVTSSSRTTRTAAAMPCSASTSR